MKRIYLIRKRIYLILLILISLFIVSCNSKGIYISENNIEVDINKTLTLNKLYQGEIVKYVSSDENILKIDGYNATPIKTGSAIISVYSNVDNELISQYLINVVDNSVKKITITGNTEVKVGEAIQLSVAVNNSNNTSNGTVILDNIKWKSCDEGIASVVSSNNKYAVIIGNKEGIVTIKAYLDNDESVYDEISILVKGEQSYSSTDTEYTKSESTINISNMTNAFQSIIEKTNTSIIGVKSYYRYFNKTYEAYNASGIIYKRTCILEDGSEVDEVNDEAKILTYKYYVVTNKHIVNNLLNITIYDENDEYTCEVIACDKKVNIAVVTFKSMKYFSEAKFGDSEIIQNGEFVICMGNNLGKEYYHSSTLGVVSYNNRYLADDTDGDRVSDWDALYIQHDAATSDGSSGGALVNMKGEIVGINTLRISDEAVDNMGFAIPSNLALELIELLEQGIIPERPLLNISVYEVKDILASDTLLSQCPIPEGLNYGMYVAEVEIDGVAHKAGIKAGDIILSFGGVKLSFSYELRAAINKCIIGSGEEVEIIVSRNGEEVILKAVF